MKEKVIKSRAGWKTKIRVIIRDLEGNIKETWESPNLLMNVAFNMARDGLKGDASDLEIKYMAWGDDNTVPDVTQTMLSNEVGRKIMTSKTAGGIGELVSVCYIGPAEAVGTIEELGWFAGVGAGAGADTGIMVGRVLYSKVKTNLESLQIERIDTFEEVP